MTEVLKLTYKEMVKIISGDLDDRFEILYNRIPYDSTDPTDDPNNYIEDDGRQLRYFEFKDKTTNIEYGFSYVWHAYHGFDMPFSMMSGLPDGIEWVKESVLFPPVQVVPVVEPKTAEQIADEAIWAPYKELVDSGLAKPFVKGMVPENIVKDLRKWIKTNKFNLYELRAKVIPVCVTYEVEQKSFWQYIQGWKKK